MAPLSPETLNNGVEIPQVGFGVFKVPAAETKAAVTSALDIGYRHLDTAKLYGNEAAVGEAITESGLDRSELFVTTKVWNDDQGYDATLRAFDASMQRLGLDQLDLYLIHWPYPGQDKYVDTWRALERVYADGRVRSIGVSNFQPHHLQRLLDETDTVPVINQVELHPWLQQRALRDFHSQHGILTEAWSPISRGARLGDPSIVQLADKHSTSPGPGDPAVASRHRERDHPEVRAPGADGSQPRRVRHLARRRGPRDDCSPRRRHPDRPRPRSVRCLDGDRALPVIELVEIRPSWFRQAQPPKWCQPLT